MTSLEPMPDHLWDEMTAYAALADRLAAANLRVAFDPGPRGVRIFLVQSCGASGAPAPKRRLHSLDAVLEVSLDLEVPEAHDVPACLSQR
jgi:hypothetical protein